MTKILIHRWKQEDCTIGRLYLDDFQCFTLELPWRQNKKSVSCIPNGNYEYFFRESPSNGDVLQLKNVNMRSYIQIHAGNYTSQIKGCILVGDSIRWLNSDRVPDVTNSRNTLADLLRRAGQSGTVELYE